MRLFTIGFTKSTAESFFGRIKGAGVKRVADVRLNNVSQLAGFAKKTDLKYFLGALCGAEYLHMPLLAPDQEMLDAYKKEGGDWKTYEGRFLNLMRAREIDRQISRSSLQDACLLCSEATPHHCHRRLVAEYLSEKWGGIEIVHL